MADLPLDPFEQSDEPAGSPDVVIAWLQGTLDRGAEIAQVSGGTVYQGGVRFPRGDTVTFDTVAGDAIAWTPGSAWTGVFPQALYSSMAAFLLAWRGAVPLHGTAVRIDGKAVLIRGRSGLGKSTLAAGLIAQGGRVCGYIPPMPPFFRDARRCRPTMFRGNMWCSHRMSANRRTCCLGRMG